MAKKYYVVWVGRKTGIFTDWDSCLKQVDRFAGAKYKSFQTRDAAEVAFKSGVSALKPKKTSGTKSGKRAAHSVKTLTDDEVIALPYEIKIFTDGACEPNPGEAGSGVAIYRNNIIDELWYGLYNPTGTNNTAELNALYHALRLAKDELASGVSVAILCDSKYSIQCVTQWASGWERKGWKRGKNEEIKNLALIQEMYALYNAISKELGVYHVNGHVGIEGNELADRMSMLAVAHQEKKFCKYPEPIDVDQILAMANG